MLEYKGKLNLLIDLCKKKKYDGYILPSTDEYLNEYVPEHKQRLKWLTGFSGSNGIFLYFDGLFYFFTDGRYLVQAKSELPPWFKIYDISINSIYDFLIKKKSIKSKICIDSKINSVQFVLKLIRITRSTKIKIFPGSKILIDKLFEICETSTTKKAFILDDKYSGCSAKKKINLIKKKIECDQCYIITSPESTAWLLNLRGYDLDFTPIVMSRMIFFGSGEVYLYIKKKKLSSEINFLFSRIGISVRTEDQIYDDIGKINKKKKILIDKESSYFFYHQIKKKKLELIMIDDICKKEKSIKNKVEISNIKKVHVRDAVAIIKFMYWLEKKMVISRFNELQVSQKLENFRKEEDSYFSPSFDTISATGKNASIIHYNPKNTKSKILNSDELYLCDSGGQYFGGTTDITRTFFIGNKKPKKEYIEIYTEVLKGHIDLAKMRFPENTLGIQIDAIARYNLWNHGKDYNHGTGHGVGCFLGVHEGPQSFSKRSFKEPIKEGMILSNEPGFYKNLNYGVRLENLILVKKSTYKNFLEFENLTLVPFERKLINKKKLNETQIRWINEYHKLVYKLVAVFLSKEIKVWLKNKIKSI